MYKPKTTTEKVCRWLLYILMSIFTTTTLYYRWMVYPQLTKQEFAKEMWGDGNWVYLIGIVIVFSFLYVRSNWSKFMNK